MRKVWNVLEYGVLKDSALIQTEALQKVIDLCHANQGGEVLLPEGIYNTGSLRLYDNMTLRLQAGARLQGSRKIQDYTDFGRQTTLRYMNDPYRRKAEHLPEYYVHALLCADHACNLSIIGEEGAVIDGMDVLDREGEEYFRGPMGISLSCCSQVRLEGFTFENSANWCLQLDSCQDIEVVKVKIYGGHDGLDLHHCTKIRVSDCDFQTGDDCFAGYDVQDLVVKNCRLNSSCSIMRLGGSDLLVTDCLIEGPGKFPHRMDMNYETHRLFKYFCSAHDTIRSDGKRIVIQNCTIRNIPQLIQYEHQNQKFLQQGRPLREVTFLHNAIEGIKVPSYIQGRGEACTIRLIDCKLMPASGIDLDSLFEIDESVTIEDVSI